MAGFWRTCRTTLRWCRFALWAVVLLALIFLGWINLIGVPGFVKNRITDSLRERGVQLEFTRMRWRLVHGLVVDNVRIVGGESGPLQPSLTAGEVQLRLDYHELLHRQFKLDGIVVRQGKLVLPVTDTNSLTAFNIEAQIRFPAHDTWAVDDLRADFAGTQLHLAGQVEHVSDIAKWKIVTGRKPAERGALAEPLKEFSDQLALVHFSGLPLLNVTLEGDADNIHTFKLRMNAVVPAVTSPWCAASNLVAAVNVTAPVDARTNADPVLDFWTNAEPFRVAWITRASDLECHDISARNVKCQASWFAPKLEIEELSANFDSGRIAARAGLNVETRELTFTNSSDLDPHDFATLFPEKARHVFDEITWTSQPPLFHAGGHFAVPPWTNDLPQSFDDILPALNLEGDLAFSNAVFYGSTVDLAHTHFSLADSMYTLSGLKIAQGRTQLTFDGQLSAITKNFRVAVRGALDSDSVKPLVADTKAAKLFDFIVLVEPLMLNLNAAGNLNSLADTSGGGHLSLTNFAIRGQTMGSVDTDVACSNRVVNFLHPVGFRSLNTQTMTADSVTLDFNARMIRFTNGFSTAEQMIIPRAIGPKTASAIEPYQYLSPPTVRVHGQIPLRDVNSGRDLAGTDMYFDVIKGAPFRWSHLMSTNITGTIHWMGQSMVLTNVAAGCYNGFARGGAYFDFRPTGYGCDFNFFVDATNLDVHALALGLTGDPTNQLEGRLSGLVTITSGNSDTWQSWFGYGSGRMTDGLLWNIPLFGFVSPMLNSVSPGLGNSRATEAKLDFSMTNGVARTSSLVINTPTMRLNYIGTIDLQQHVNAYVTAQLMRNTWFGPVVSTVLWPVSKIFECRVTGLANDPKVTPILFPFSKYFFSPVRSMQNLFTISTNSPAWTNSVTPARKK